MRDVEAKASNEKAPRWRSLRSKLNCGSLGVGRDESLASTQIRKITFASHYYRKL